MNCYPKERRITIAYSSLYGEREVFRMQKKFNSDCNICLQLEYSKNIDLVFYYGIFYRYRQTAGIFNKKRINQTFSIFHTYVRLNRLEFLTNSICPKS